MNNQTEQLIALSKQFYLIKKELFAIKYCHT